MTGLASVGSVGIGSLKEGTTLELIMVGFKTFHLSSTETPLGLGDFLLG